MLRELSLLGIDPESLNGPLWVESGSSQPRSERPLWLASKPKMSPDFSRY